MLSKCYAIILFISNVINNYVRYIVKKIIYSNSEIMLYIVRILCSNNFI